MGVETGYYIKQHVIVKIIKCIREDVNYLWANYSQFKIKLACRSQLATPEAT